MIWMSTILGVLFLGITFLLGHIGAVPSEEETVISSWRGPHLTAVAFSTWARSSAYDHLDPGNQYRFCRFPA
jgi:hypothetical protein